MISRHDLLTETRRWIGTPYRHQASTLGIGADCLGLIRGVWRNIIGQEPETIPAYTADWSEPSGKEVLLIAACRWLVPKPLTSVEVAEVIVFRMRDGGVAKHLGITAESNGHPTFLHSYTDHGVVESSLSGPWQRKIIARFDFPHGVK